MKNKFLKNRIVLVALMILLGSFSIALAAPGDAPSRPPVHPGNSSQPVLNLKVGGSNLASAGLDVAGSNALSFFDKVDSFITVFGRLWIGGNTWLGLPGLFSVPSTDPLNPGLIPLPIRTLNIAGTFLSSTLSHDGVIAAQRAVCVQNSKLILCTAPAVTYQWDISAWGPCTGATSGSCSGSYSTMNTKINWAGQPYNWTLGEEYDTGTTACTIYRIASCVPGNCNWTYETYSYDAYGFTNGVGASGYDPTCGYNFSGQDTPIATGIAGPATSFSSVSCSTSNPTTESSCESQNSACTWNNGSTSTQTRSVVCKGSNGTTVADSFCVQPKPSTSQPCTNGLCDITQNNGCIQGILSDTTDSSANYLWSCMGSNGGIDVNCSKPIPPLSWLSCTPPITQDAWNMNGNRCSCPTNIPESCNRYNSFIAGTMISLPNDEVIAIEKIKIGDTVLTSSGTGIVEDIHKYTSNENIYSINNSNYFVTASHPFMTTTGWKSFNPEGTRIKVPSIKTNLIQYGDILIKQDGNYEEIKKINSVPGQHEVYNLSVNKTHDFYANGYWVHNK